MARPTSSGARKPLLVDPNGRPVASWSFFEAGDLNVRRERPYHFYNAANDWDQLLSVGSWKQIMSSGRFLVANVPIIRGALMEQARYSFPLQAHYVGKDREAGRVAEEFLFEWKKCNNVRGGPYGATENARVRMLGRKIDGDIATAYVRRTGDVFPKLQYIRAHRIGDRGANSKGSPQAAAVDQNGILKAGPFKGCRIANGVIKDEWGEAKAYRVLGETEKDDIDYGADSMFLTFNPETGDQSRGMSELVASIRSFADIKRLRDYEMRAQQLCAAIALINKNPTGTADEASDAVNRDPNAGTAQAAGSPSGLVYETYADGMIMHMKTDGSGLEAFRGERPAKDAQDWEDKIVTQALYGIGWDPNFALAIKEPGGNWSRVVTDKINFGIDENVAIEARDQAREDFWALSIAAKEGLIPQPKDGDLHSWEYVLEKRRLTGDSGNERAALRDDYKLGIISARTIYAGRGKWWLDERFQRETEVTDLIERAQRIKTEFPELSLQDCLNLLEQRTPNANMSGTAPEPDPGVGNSGKEGTND